MGHSESEPGPNIQQVGERGRALSRRQLNLVVGGVIAATIVMFLLGLEAMHVVAGIRAFVGAESIWSKNEKEGALHLLEYGHHGTEENWREYRNRLDVIRGFARARRELESPEPDLRIIAEGLIDGGVDPRDVRPMTNLFLRFRSVDHVDRAAAVWSHADELVNELARRADVLREVKRSGAGGEVGVESAIDEIVALAGQLDGVENEFARAMADAARWTVWVLRIVMGVCVLFIGGVCVWFALAGARMLKRSDIYAATLEKQNWITTSRNEIAGLLEGQNDEGSLARDLIRFLVPRLGGQVGAFYVTGEDGALQLIASHAFADRKHAVNRYEPGDGLVGQAALERTTVVVSQLPDDYMPIHSGLGETRPRAVLVHPFVLEREVMGAVEVASVTEFGDDHRQLVEAAGEAIAIALHSARSRHKLDQLLEQTKLQAANMQELNEELTTQQEELREANEELEQQARSLEASQSQLEEQQQRLEETNAELEERTEALDNERREVARKNVDLEDARKILETKARELEITSTYKSEFLANMSHELRTPLNSIIILSKMLADNRDQTLTEKQLEFAGTIHNSGNDLLNLISEILDLSKIEAGKIDMVFDDFDLDELVEALRRQFEPIASQRGLQLVFERVEPAPRRLVSDAHRLSQILKNLLSNAVKFTEEGQIRLTVAPVNDEQVLRAGISGDADSLVAITVEDSGIGIPVDKQAIVFEAFQQADGTTDRKYGGTGLGLAISRELARRLGGDILVDSVPGEGSRFTVLVSTRPSSGSAPDAPHTKSNATPSPPTSAEPPTAVGGDDRPNPQTRAVTVGEEVVDDRATLTPDDRSLLIIEDDPGFALTLRELARERGFKCLVAVTGKTGLDLASRFKPSAVLLDLGLPEMDGMTVMERLKETPETRHIPVHVISGSERKFETLKAGGVGFLHKPVSVLQLDEAFGRLEDVISRPVKSLLVVDSDDASRAAVVDLIDAADVEITVASTAEQALDHLTRSRFDCVLMALDLPDRPGHELLTAIRTGDESADTPVVIVADRELSTDETLTLDRYADRIIRGNRRRTARILDETSLFLHRVEQNLPEEQRKMIRMLHDREAILAHRKVLLVDDDMRNIFALTAVLEDKDMQVEFARNGREALERLDEHPDADVVLMDIMMPEMDGYEATRRIREQDRYRSLPIIALTAKAMQGDRAKCLAAGASDYITKPVDTDKLLSVLRVWLCR